MGNLFSKRKEGKITEADRAVLTLKTQRRKLTAERQRIDLVIQREVAAARALLAEKKKGRALLALKKKKLQEAQAERIDAWLLNVEELLGTIEAARQQGRLYAALKQGHAAITELQKVVTLDDVERLQEDSAEAAAYQQRIEALLAESLTPEQDAAAEAELAGLEAALAPPLAPRADADVAAELPAVPTHKVEVPAGQAEATAVSVAASEAIDPVDQLRATAQRQGTVAVEEPLAA